MERPQRQPDVAAPRIREMQRAVLSKPISAALKLNWLAILDLVDFRSARIELTPGDISNLLGRSDRRSRENLQTLIEFGCLTVFREPNAKSRKPGSRLWDVGVLDPLEDVQIQIARLAKANPQTTFEFAGDDTNVDGAPSDAEGPAPGDAATRAPEARDVVPYQSRQDGDSRKPDGDDAYQTSTGHSSRPSTSARDGRSSNDRCGGVGVNSAAPSSGARHAPLTPGINKTITHSLDHSGAGTRFGAQGARGGSDARSAAPADDGPTAIGGAFAAVLRSINQGPQVDRAAAGDRWVAYFDDAWHFARRPDAWLVRKLADWTADAVWPAECLQRCLDAVYSADRKARKETGRGLGNPAGYLHRAAQTVARERQLEWRTGASLA